MKAKDFETLEAQALSREARIALLQAGKFVAAYVLGSKQIHRLTLKPSEDNCNGLANAATTYEKQDEEAIEQRAIELWSGYLAQEALPMMSGSKAPSRVGEDLECIVSLVSMLPEGPEEETLRNLRARTEGLIHDHWPIITGIAGMLLEFEVVDGESAEAWISWALGEQDSNALEQVLLLEPKTHMTEFGKELVEAEAVDSFLRNRWENWQLFIVDLGEDRESVSENLTQVSQANFKLRSLNRTDFTVFKQLLSNLAQRLRDTDRLVAAIQQLLSDRSTVQGSFEFDGEVHDLTEMSAHWKYLVEILRQEAEGFTTVASKLGRSSDIDSGDSNSTN